MRGLVKDMRTADGFVLTNFARTEGNRAEIRVAARRMVCCYLGHGLVIAKSEAFVVLRGEDRMCMDCAERCRIVKGRDLQHADPVKGRSR
jgi:hypothetical protein